MAPKSIENREKWDSNNDRKIDEKNELQNDAGNPGCGPLKNFKNSNLEGSEDLRGTRALHYVPQGHGGGYIYIYIYI